MQQQNFQWGVLDEVELAHNQSRRFLFTLKETPNHQLYVDMGSCLQDLPPNEGRRGGLSMDLRTFIAFMLNVDDCLSRARQVLNHPRFAGLYGLAGLQEEGVSDASKSALVTFRMHVSLNVRASFYLNSQSFQINSFILIFSSRPRSATRSTSRSREIETRHARLRIERGVKALDETSERARHQLEVFLLTSTSRV